MNIIKKTVLVPHSAERMFDLVNRVEDYPNFLPWCSKTEILKQEDNILEARVYMDYMRIKQSFCTHNINNFGKSIHITLLDGPFKSLNGQWYFTHLGSMGSKIDFQLEYSFSNILLSKLIGPVFHLITNSLVEAFIKEANNRYGK